MKIAITTTQVPFIHGGAEFMTQNLYKALVDDGHQVEVISMPFVFNSKSRIKENMDSWGKQNFNHFDIGNIDKVICLKFPTYYLQHPNKTVWLMHQHRSVYDLWNTPHGDVSTDSAACRLRDDIIQQDMHSLGETVKNYTISKTVSARLRKYNNIDSEHLYQPSPLFNLLRPGEQNPYIFCPSRLEGLKRQELLIRAAAKCKTPCVFLIAGTGTLAGYLQGLIGELNIGHKVRLLGHVSESELVNLYRNSLGVFFAPINEDYGFVTLEAMQSAKPIITCTDSGGPLEFVIDSETGYVVEPDPVTIAEKIDFLYHNRTKAKNMGMNGFNAYNALNLSWDNVVAKLLETPIGRGGEK